MIDATARLCASGDKMAHGPGSTTRERDQQVPAAGKGHRAGVGYCRLELVAEGDVAAVIAVIAIVTIVAVVSGGERAGAGGSGGDGTR